jgi:outer membrane lipoprotein-sorting protein
MMGHAALRFIAIAFAGLAFSSRDLAAQSRQDPMAAKILLEVGTRYKKMPGFSAEFTRESQDIKGDVQSSTTGNIMVSGSKYRLKTGTTTLFCDGKTVWTADKKIKEVSIAEYDPEPDDITPERVYTFYKKGYKFIFIGEVKSGNTVWQTIDLEPENLEKEISKIRLFVDRKTKEIRKWIVFERGSNEREEFEIRKFTVLAKTPEKELRFEKAAFPGYKLVDLR